MKIKALLFSILLILSFQTTAQVQQTQTFVDAKKSLEESICKKSPFDECSIIVSNFVNEDYRLVVSIYNENEKWYSTNSVGQNLHLDAKDCDSLLNKVHNMNAFNKIKNIREEVYKITYCPITDKKIEGYKNNQLPDTGKKELKFKKAVGSEPLNDSIPLERIKDFFNQFENAYQNKDLDFIKKVFSDYALIIRQTTVDYYTENGEKVSVFKKLNKEQYITELGQAFDNNREIKVDFYELEAYRNKENVYGINALQNWYSSNNYDESGLGWVYFEIDFKNIQEPIIWIKTWQRYDTSRKERFRIGKIPSM
ncbi:MAG: hypothetical protein LBV71_12165 [Prevotella sp.]|jgi:hypothetical protein|nr:hypothetical protein [Prevotella sp.]